MSQLAVNTPGRTPIVPARRVGSTCSDDDRVDVFERSGADHRGGPVAGFLSRLKNATPRDRPGESALAFELIERRDRAEHRGRVDVVPAGVHHLRHAAVIVDRLLVLNPQRIAIGPHGDPLLGRRIAAIDHHATTFGPHPHLSPAFAKS